MFRLLPLAALVCAASASDLRFLSLPQSIRLPAPAASQPLSTSDLALLNSNLLGLRAQTPKGFDVETSLFSRPRALAVVQVSGLELPADGNKYAVEKTGNADITAVEEALAVTFGADRESVAVSGAGITGSSIAQKASQQKVDGSSIKTKFPALRAELENIYALAAAITASGANFNKDSADIYRIDIQGLSGLELTADEKATVASDINNALEQLAKAMNTAYGDQVVLEVISISAPVAPAFNASADQHHIRKRDATDPTDSVDKNLKQYREGFNVSVFTSSDYPAIFAIFAGLIIALVLAVLYTTVGMMTMDPGKDSIIYRMTTTRMKKD